MADADFPSDYEREIHRNERAVDEHRRRQEMEAEVERLKADEELHRRAIDAGANYVKELEAELERLRAELERRTASLTAEVARLVVSRAALENRLEDLMDRWTSERNALVRQLAIRAIDGDRRARAEMLLRCIEELNGAIPGE